MLCAVIHIKYVTVYQHIGDWNRKQVLYFVAKVCFEYNANVS